MRLDFSNYHQLITFLLSVALGAVFCLIYDLVRFWHFNKKSKSCVIFLVDILYFAVIGIMAFCFFVLYCKGTIRIYVFLGELLGFIVCRFTLSRLFMRLLSLLLSTISFIVRVISVPVKFIYGLLQKIYRKIRKAVKRAMFKFYTFRKKRKVKLSALRQQRTAQREKQKTEQKAKSRAKEGTAGGNNRQNGRKNPKKRKKLRKSP